MTRTLISKPAVRVADALDERCDRCGAAAKLVARFTAGGDLAFCGHHANRYAPRIVETAGVVVVQPHFAWRGTEGDAR
jgi:hypothetical protein